MPSFEVHKRRIDSYFCTGLQYLNSSYESLGECRNLKCNIYVDAKFFQLQNLQKDQVFQVFYFKETFN